MSQAIKNQVGDWYELLEPILSTPTFKKIATHIKTRKANGYKILPETSNTFRAFKLCQKKDTKVIILGQDPYHDGSATGLAFANKSDSLRVSPSLKNIITAVEQDLDSLLIDFDITLESWAEQGVLLLNTALTVEKARPGIHTELWRPFTQLVLEAISSQKDGYVFMLWGKKAQDYEKFIIGNHTILKAAHPAAESYSGGRAGFFSCGHFTSANQVLPNSICWSGVPDSDFLKPPKEPCPF